MALSISETEIPGLLVLELPVHGDSRGWFKEFWQREKMVSLGLPDFAPVQNNISFNEGVGTTRGIHAEPWDKLISVATGKVFGAWVDLREGRSFGATFTCEIDSSRAVFVPRGVGNSFQTLQANTAYTYLVNDHWSPTAAYTNLNLSDSNADIQWPIPLSQAEISEKDQGHPRLNDVVPVKPKKILVVGAGGMLGRALRREFADSAHVEYAEHHTLDIAGDLDSIRPWRQYQAIVNAAAYTSVDEAETAQGRVDAWHANAVGVANLARVANDYGLTLVHLSTDYVFDGAAPEPYGEETPVSPVSVYGQSKAAGDLAAATVPRHYILRTSWVIGEGQNFVRTMLSLAQSGTDARVVEDQRGRLTFTNDLARAVRHLLETRPDYGVYNVTSAGEATTWKQIATQVFAECGHDPERVTGVTTEEYFSGTTEPSAARPRNSILDLTKIEATGFVLVDQRLRLREYVMSMNEQ